MTENQEKKYYVDCPQCGDRIEYAKLAFHNDTAHPKKKPYVNCAFCFKSIEFDLLDAHILQEHTPPELHEMLKPLFEASEKAREIAEDERHATLIHTLSGIENALQRANEALIDIAEHLKKK